MTTNTTTLSGYLLDYYAALAENMPNPRLVKHQRDDAYICTIRQEPFHRHFEAYSLTTKPVLTLPIIEKLASRFQIISVGDDNIIFTLSWLDLEDRSMGKIRTTGATFTEAALRALVAWKFPDGLPEPVYESEK